jgi:hypothetical protein
LMNHHPHGWRISWRFGSQIDSIGLMDKDYYFKERKMRLPLKSSRKLRWELIYCRWAFSCLYKNVLNIKQLNYSLPPRRYSAVMLTRPCNDSATVKFLSQPIACKRRCCVFLGHPPN